MRGLIFDLDGTLVDTVYAHVFAWQRAFAEAGLAIDGWRIHRRIGMSGGLFARAAARELGHPIDGAARLKCCSGVTANYSANSCRFPARFRAHSNF